MEDFEFADVGDPWAEDEEKHGKKKSSGVWLDIPDKIAKRFAQKNAQVIQKVDAIGLPKKGWQLRLITTKAFNSIAIIKMIAERECIEEATMVIYSINKQAAQVLIDLQKAGLLKNCTLIFSSLINAGYKNKSLAFDALKEYFPIVQCTSHAKISILRTGENNYYSIEGSGNFSYNARLEQYVIDNDKFLYDFSKEWIEEIKNIK